MKEWQTVALGDVIQLQRGFDLTEKQASRGNVPVFSSGGISYFTAEPKCQGPGVITGRKGVLGKVHYSPGEYWPHDTTLWVKDFKDSCPRFIYYLLQTLPLAALDAGASNPTLNRNHVHLLPVRVPPPHVQKQIAEVLGALDDLVENNLRRVELLDEMGRAIYREWFVYFRYPGREKDKLVDSSLGIIPSTWSISTVGREARNFDRARRPLSGRERRERPGPYTYYGAAKPLDLIDGYLFDGDYLLVAEDGSVITTNGFPVLQRVRGKFWVSNHAHILQGGERISTSYLQRVLERYPIAGYVTGAAQPKVTQANLNRIPIVVPPRSIMLAEAETTEPMVQQLFALDEANVRLRQIRDLLLPQLVTGQIDVSMLDLDRVLEEAVG